MAKVVCSFEEVTITNDNGREVDGVRATCTRCGDTAESFGTGLKSRIRSLILLKENCSMNERNFYVDEDDE